VGLLEGQCDLLPAICADRTWDARRYGRDRYAEIVAIVRPERHGLRAGFHDGERAVGVGGGSDGLHDRVCGLGMGRVSVVPGLLPFVCRSLALIRCDLL